MNEAVPPDTVERGTPARLAAREVGIRSLGHPNALARQFDFSDDTYEWRRLFSELFGTFLLVFVAAGGPMANARFLGHGGQGISAGALVVAPGLMVLAIILFMGAVSGAHLNPAVTIAFMLRGDFPGRRVPMYIVAQFVGAVLATLVLVGLIGTQGTAGLTLASLPPRRWPGRRFLRLGWSASFSERPRARSRSARWPRSRSAAT
jgi:aquaporin Z